MYVKKGGSANYRGKRKSAVMVRARRNWGWFPSASEKRGSGGESDQYEKIINHGLSTIGNKMWLPATTASGKMTAQSTPGICHPGGTRPVERTTIITIMKKLMTSDSQNRRRMRGTSMKKLDRSTSFLVAPHVMLNEKRCARSACDR
jgi:hypothetical protein